MSETNADRQDRVRRNAKTAEQLGILKSSITKTIDAWRKFLKRDVGYFLDQESTSWVSTKIQPLIDAIDTTYLELEDMSKSLEELHSAVISDSNRVSRVNSQSLCSGLFD